MTIRFHSNKSVTRAGFKVLLKGKNKTFRIPILNIFLNSPIGEENWVKVSERKVKFMELEVNISIMILKLYSIVLKILFKIKSSYQKVYIT